MHIFAPLAEYIPTTHELRYQGQILTTRAVTSRDVLVRRGQHNLQSLDDVVVVLPTYLPAAHARQDVDEENACTTSLPMCYIQSLLVSQQPRRDD